MCGSSDCEVELGLEVGLIEIREHATGVGGFVLRIEIGLAVGRISEPVQTLARGGIASPRLDRQGIAAGADGERDSGTVEDVGGGEALTIDQNGGHGIGDEVDECRIDEASGEVDDSARQVRVGFGFGVADVDMD
jgi:hypothetical protein